MTGMSVSSLTALFGDLARQGARLSLRGKFDTLSRLAAKFRAHGTEDAAEPKQWITVNGAAVPLDDEGNPAGKVGKKLKDEKGGKTASAASGLVSAPKNRDEWPEHMRKVYIPPGWSDVKISSDPESKLLAVGYDKKGREQRKYSEAFTKENSEKKFSRINTLNKDFDKFEKGIAELKNSKDKKERDIADALDLISKTGLRPGSDRDTQADKEARGASNLKGENVIIDGNEVRLKFTGKKGVDLDLPVTDPGLKKMLVERKKAAGDDGRVFGKTKDADIRKVMKETVGDYKVKDLRTRLGTNSAIEAISKMPKPASEKEYQKFRNQVGDEVSRKLGNTRSVALSSYIMPDVFNVWK